MFRRATFLAGEATGAGLPDVWWFRPDGRKMTRRDWEQRRRAAARRLPQRRRSIADATPHGEPVRRRLVPAALQRPPRGRRRSRCPPRALRPRAGRSSSRPPTPEREPGARSTAARGDRACAVALAAPCCGARERRRELSCRATYRLQLGAELDFAAARGARARTCASSASATSTSRRRSRRGAGSTHGYDVVDPRRVSRGARRRGGAPRAAAAARGSASCSTSSRTTWRPTRRTRSGATRSCARSSSTSTRRTGRHRRFFDIDELAGVRVEDPEVFETTHALGRSSSSREGLVDGLRIDHPDGLADPRGYLERLRDARRRARLGREDPRARRAAARLAGRGHDRLRVR